MWTEAAEDDVNRAVAAAAKAFAPGSPWRTMDASARGRLLLKLADLVERDAAYIAALDSWNNGKPFADCTRYDMPGTYGLIRYYAGWAGGSWQTTSWRCHVVSHNAVSSILQTKSTG